MGEKRRQITLALAGDALSPILIRRSPEKRYGIPALIPHTSRSGIIVEEGQAARLNSELEKRLVTAAWVARSILPHEPAMRRWLARARMTREDVDDIIQEAYCNLAEIDDPKRITEPAGYFFSVVRNELLRRIKRSRVIPIAAIPSHDLNVSDEAPSAEREVGSRLDLIKLRHIMAKLPRRCRRIIEMRKMEGLSQRETANRLGLTETIVENDVKLGLLAIMIKWRENEADGERRLAALDKSRSGSVR